MKKIVGLLTFLIAVLFAAGIWQFVYFKTQLNAIRKVYVYDVDKTLNMAGIVDLKRQLEVDVAALNNEVAAAEKKLKTIKDAKLKAEYSDVYVKSLRTKRDMLLENYDKSLHETLTKINDVLAEIAIERNLPTIFYVKSVVVNTADVVDVTDEVVARVTKK